ncbi:MAG: MgtC/SapB family protein [Fimbriimonadaceae bacterium]
MTVFDGIFEPKALAAAADALIKLLIGGFLAGAIGWEREIHGRPAGIRTHMLVVMGVILFSEASKGFGGDPSRVAAQIVTGIGFLGAGTILRIGPDVKGLTTAASIWAAAGIGMAISVGGALLLVAAGATVLVLVTLALLDKLEQRINPASKASNLHIVLESGKALGGVIEAIVSAGGLVRQMRFSDDESGLNVAISVKGDHHKLVSAVSEVAGVESANWE